MLFSIPSIITPVIVQQLSHDFPVVMDALVALEITELDVIFKEIDINSTVAPCMSYMRRKHTVIFFNTTTDAWGYFSTKDTSRP